MEVFHTPTQARLGFISLTPQTEKWISRISLGVGKLLINHHSYPLSALSPKPLPFFSRQFHSCVVYFHLNPSHPTSSLRDFWLSKVWS